MPDRPARPRDHRAVDRGDLDVDGGVHRFRDDMFYGGGQWPLLAACSASHMRGRGDLDARSRPARLGGGDRRRRRLPARAGRRPPARTPIASTSGSTAGGRSPRRCCGATACTSASPSSSASTRRSRARLIRHRTAAGSGHPYSVDTEQRMPVDPIAGRAAHARRPHDARRRRASSCELRGDRADGTQTTGRRSRASPAPRAARAIDGGHLARPRRGSPARRAAGPVDARRAAPPASDALPVRRRRRTARAAHPLVRDDRSAAGAARRTRPSRARGGAASCRAASVGARRRRDACAASGSPCRSAPGEHVAGFGERFDALDQRGTEPRLRRVRAVQEPGRASARPTCRCRSRTSSAATAGASTCAPRVGRGSTSAPPTPDALWVEARDGRR